MTPPLGFLPLPPKRRTHRTSPRRGHRRTSDQGALVLVVDDIEDNREMYAQFLRFAGYRVEVAVDGFDALSKAAAVHPDVIIMDLALPGMDGWETTRRLKSDSRTQDIPVIALTGHVVRESRTRAIEAGCTAFLTKPCLPDDLAEEVRRALEIRT